MIKAVHIPKAPGVGTMVEIASGIVTTQVLLYQLKGRQHHEEDADIGLPDTVKIELPAEIVRIFMLTL